MPHVCVCGKSQHTISTSESLPLASEPTLTENHNSQHTLHPLINATSILSTATSDDVRVQQSIILGAEAMLPQSACQRPAPPPRGPAPLLGPRPALAQRPALLLCWEKQAPVAPDQLWCSGQRLSQRTPHLCCWPPAGPLRPAASRAAAPSRALDHH